MGKDVAEPARYRLWGGSRRRRGPDFL